MVQGKGAALLSEFASEVETAKAVKAQNADSKGKRAISQANGLIKTLAEMDTAEALRDSLSEMVTQFSEVETAAFDKTQGMLLASVVKAQVETPEDYRLTGFDTDQAETLLGEWKTATGGRGPGSGSGDSAQRTPVPVRVTFTFPDSHTEVITHNYWSSVSNEITQRAKALEGFEGKGYRRPEEAAKEWKAAATSIKTGGNGGVVTIPTKVGNLTAEVTAVR